MAKSPSSLGDFFDLERIRQLADLMGQHELNELELEHGESRLRIRRRYAAETATTIMAAPSVMASEASPRVAASAVAPATPPADDKAVFIRSPMIGTFFASPNPDSPPFVKVGDVVGPATPVCIIEAMKVFNPLPAEISGKILAILVKNGEPVEYNQPLFKVEPA